MKQLKDEKLINFDPNYPFLLPDDWKDRRAPTVYEILATSNTLKQMYAPVSYTHLTLPTILLV